MKIERIVLDGENNCCSLEESQYNMETEKYETKRHIGSGYKVGYNCYCEECLKAITEGTKILEGNKKIKAIEI